MQILGAHSSFLRCRWGLWRWQNEKVIGDDKWSVEFTCTWIWILDPLRFERWLLPPKGFVFLTVDGAYSHTQEHMRMSEVISDSQNVWQVGFFLQVWMVEIRY